MNENTRLTAETIRAMGQEEISGITDAQFGQLSSEQQSLLKEQATALGLRKEGYVEQVQDDLAEATENSDTPAMPVISEGRSATVEEMDEALAAVGKNLADTNGETDALSNPENQPVEAVMITPEQWDSGLRPNGYEGTTDIYKRVKQEGLTHEDVLGEEKSNKWEDLLTKARTIGLTEAESQEMVTLSKEFNAKAKELINQQENNQNDSEDRELDQARRVQQEAADIIDGINLQYQQGDDYNEIQKQIGESVNQIRDPRVRKVVQDYLDSFGDNLRAWNKKQGIEQGKGEATQDSIRFDAANQLIQGNPVSDEQLLALNVDDIKKYSIGEEQQSLLNRRQKLVEKATKSEDASKEAEPKLVDKTEEIRAEINQLPENYFAEFRKEIESDDSLPGPVRKASLACIDSRITRSKLRDQLVDKEASLAERQKSLAEYNRNIARLKKALGFARFAIIGALLAGGLGASLGSMGGKELAFILGGVGVGIGGVGGGLSYEWFSKERRTLDIDVAQSEKIMVQADIRVEDVKEAKNKGEITDLEAFIKLSSWLKAKQYGITTEAMQKEYNSVIDLPGLKTALGYK